MRAQGRHPCRRWSPPSGVRYRIQQPERNTDRAGPGRGGAYRQIPPAGGGPQPAPRNPRRRCRQHGPDGSGSGRGLRCRAMVRSVIAPCPSIRSPFQGRKRTAVAATALVLAGAVLLLRRRRGRRGLHGQQAGPTAPEGGAVEGEQSKGSFRFLRLDAGEFEFRVKAPPDWLTRLRDPGGWLTACPAAVELLDT